MTLDKNSSDEKPLSAQELLSALNGFCKINYEVPQTRTFYTSDSLLPINARPQLLDICEPEGNTVDNMDDTFNNFQISETAEETDDNQYPSKIKSTDEVLSNSLPRKDDHGSLSPKNENASLNYNNQYKKDELEGDSSHDLQDQEDNKKPMEIAKNVSDPDSPANSKKENPLNSQCPICFGMFPSLDIEVHASRCNPL